MKIALIIPARLHSSRLPEKPLADIEGKSLIVRVVEQALQCKNMSGVWVATDHDSIFDHVTKAGYQAVMTSSDHISGTDRIAEAAADIDADVIINIQGDEPLIHPQQIEDLAAVFTNPDIQIATQMNAIRHPEEVFDYHKVKVVTDNNHKALYFSRQAIPAFRDLPYKDWFAQTVYYKHVGIYAFRKKTLLELTKLPTGFLEKAESLEQLRWLENGFPVHCFLTEHESVGVDTQEDLDKVRTIIRMMTGPELNP